MDVCPMSYYDRDFCHGCLSFGRRCSIDNDNAGLFYQLLDPYIIVKDPINLLLCWECEATLKKIRIFQLKANKAQALFQDVITHKIEQKSLSTLTRTTKNIYDYTFNTETTISKRNKHKTLNKLKSLDCTILKLPKEKKKKDAENVDLKITNYNYEIELDTGDKQNEITLTNKSRDDKISTIKPYEVQAVDQQEDEKYAIPKVEKYAIDIESDNSLFKQESHKDINKYEQFNVEIKQESDNHYSDDNFIADNDNDDRTQDVTEKGDNSTQLVENIVHSKRKYKQTRVRRKRAKRTMIDYKNIDKYFDTVVLKPDAFKLQLKVWAKEKSFTASLFKCTSCALVFNNKAEQQSHKELHNNTTEHRCDPCSLNFQTQAELVSHGAAHEVPKCVICLYVCRSPNAREAHLKVSHARGYWKCEECNLTFRLNTELTAHREKLHFTFICDYCNTKRNTKLSLEKHITHNHLKIKSYCHLCQRTFNQKRFLKQHLIDVHKVPGLSTASKESTYCVECNKQYTSMGQYRKHLSASVVHRPRKKIVVQCPECGKTFHRKLTLKNHYKLFHGGGTKHRCDPCNKYFCSNFALTRHIERVHKKIPNPKNKVCETCGAGFTTNLTLIHHIRTHTGERPYECSHCDARFAQKYARDVHVRNRHLKHIPEFMT